MEGDKVTPVGRYRIVSKGPSRYHVFLGLDYPNAADRARFARAKAEGLLPANARIGGDVGIHGAPPQLEWKAVHKTVDWTLGCIAVDDDEIETIARATAIGTPVDIED
jgi:murein L,D-transpeptidase YafK